MSYGYYSEVYFAVSIDNPRAFKVGETVNGRRRSNQLFKQNKYWIEKTYFTGLTEANRLLAESFLRSKMESFSYVKRLQGLDYFICETSEQVQFLQDNFMSYVEEIINIITTIKFLKTP